MDRETDRQTEERGKRAKQVRQRVCACLKELNVNNKDKERN